MKLIISELVIIIPILNLFVMRKMNLIYIGASLFLRIRNEVSSWLLDIND